MDAFDKDLAAIRFNEELGMQVDTSSNMLSQASLDIQNRSYTSRSIRLPEHEVSAKDGIVRLIRRLQQILHLNSCTAWTKRGGIHVLSLDE